MDPERHIRNAIACYSINAIIEGISIFEGKRNAETLPDGVDGRYLFGIVRKVTEQNEGFEIAEALLRNRLDARDRVFAELVRARKKALSTITNINDRLSCLVDHALETERRIDRLFWIQSISNVIAREPQRERTTLFRSVARRVHAAFRISYRDRLDATRVLASKLFPLE